jgi:hypothetical protein
MVKPNANRSPVLRQPPEASAAPAPCPCEADAKSPQFNAVRENGLCDPDDPTVDEDSDDCDDCAAE